MAQQTLVTIATDGFRDYVSLPDGRQVNLGSVSVLKLVSSLVRGSYECRRALDTFNKHNRALITVDLYALEDMLKPKRARWASTDDSFIQIVSMITSHDEVKPQGKGTSMDLDTTQTEGIRTFYTKLASLEKTLSSIEGCGSVTEADITAFRTTASDLFSEVSGKTIKAAVDADVLEDLELFMDNTSSLQPKFKSIIANLKRKMESGKYDPKLSPDLWMYWVEDGVKVYAKEFSVNPKKQFPMELKKALAESFAKRYDKAVKDGEYGELKVKKASDEGEVSGPAPEVAKPLSDNDTYYKLADEADVGKGPVTGESEDVAKKTKVENPYAGKDQSKNDTYYKLAASDVPAINEAFADSVMTKVEHALKTIEASSKKGTEVARKDLGIVTSKLASLLQESSLEDPSLSSALRKLSGMVDQIQTHFS